MKRIITMAAIATTLVGVTTAKPRTFDVVGTATDLIAKYESFRATPYVCDGGKKTIGYGCTDPAVVALGKITEVKARSILRARVVKELAWVEETFGKNLTDKQKVALISAVFNIGRQGLCWKTVKGKRVHTRFYDAVIARNWAKANKELQDWNKAGGKVLNGLVKRRAEEGKLLASV